MVRKTVQIVIIAVVIIGVVFGVSCFQSRTDRDCYNAVMIPTDANTIYAQEIQSDDVAAAISVSKTETADFLPERYQLTVTLANRSKTQHEYKATLNGYSDSLICDTSNTEISYAENYSSGNHSNAKTVYYFVPDHKRSEMTNAGTLSFTLERNDPTSDKGMAVIEIAVYSPYTHQRISTITQQLCFDLVS